MNYEEQLSAAKFKAERDLVRQECERLRAKLNEAENSFIHAEYNADEHELIRKHGDLAYFGNECAKIITGMDVLVNEPVSPILDSLRKRLMPEGYEWPRYESGEPVILGDSFKDDEGNWGPAYYITFDSVNPVIIGINTIAGDYEFNVNDGERVKRPKVLAADGKPLEAGQTVWDVNDGKEFEVVNLNGGLPLLKFGETAYTATEPEHLTHTKPEPPDSWERIEEDAEKTPCAYFGMEEEGYGCSECPVKHWEESCVVAKSKDIVRRCKALAEVSER